MKGIKNIILDLGNVLIDIDEQETIDGFRKLFKHNLDFTTDWKHLPLVVDSMETGKWSIDTFYEFLLPFVKPDTDPKQIEDAWCALLGVFPARRVRMVQELSKHYNLFLLSNTNKLHIRMFRTEFRFRYHYSLENLFVKCYYSSDLGYRKPDLKIFEHVLNDAGLLPDETIMVDDNAANCQSAENLGMLSLNVPENTGIEAVFEQLMLLNQD